MDKIGIVGTGVMGLAAAVKILDAGHALTVYDVAPAAADRARQLGAQKADKPGEVARQSDIILLFLPGPAEVIDCVTASEGLLAGSQPGQVIADMSTNDPGTSEQMSKQAEKYNVGYLDAPVLGRPISIGQWALPVGGNEEFLDRCQSVFRLFASKVFHAGPSGTGHKIKLLNQLMFGAINAMTAEMMAMAEKTGVPPRQLYEIITASQAGTVSNLFKELGGRVAEDNYAEPTFTVDLLVKDIKLAVQMAKDNNAPPLLARSVELINEISQVQGFGSKDTAIMWKSYQSIWEAK